MAKRTGELAESLRAWIASESRMVQVELGDRLRQVGLHPSGQPYVSRLVNGKGRPPTLDHLKVIAEFFERSLEEMLREIGAIGDTARGESSQRRARLADLRAVARQLRGLAEDIEPSAETPAHSRETMEGMNTTRAPSPHRKEPRNKGR